MVSKWTIGIVTVVVLAFAFYFLNPAAWNKDSVPDGKYTEFAKCLTEKEVVMYGAYWCSHCQAQKKLFGDAWEEVNYVECDARGDNGNPDLCTEKGVTGYPTWIFADGSRTSGETGFP